MLRDFGQAEYEFGGCVLGIGMIEGEGRCLPRILDNGGVFMPGQEDTAQLNSSFFSGFSAFG